MWGLKRSGIHFVVNWLYANLGAAAKDALDADGLHPQLSDGFADAAAGVAFYNNCGGFHSRQFALGSLQPADFEAAMARRPSTIFGIEDCDLDLSSRTPAGPQTHQLLVLRDPLNNVASRLEGTKERPEVFRVDASYIGMFATYCEEALGRSNRLRGKIVVNYNRFVDDPPYRASIASALGVRNVDTVSEVSAYGGGSSFDTGDSPSAASLMTRFRQHPIPADILGQLVAQPVIRDACLELFGYDLAEQVGRS